MTLLQGIVLGGAAAFSVFSAWLGYVLDGKGHRHE